MTGSYMIATLTFDGLSMYYLKLRNNSCRLLQRTLDQVLPKAKAYYILSKFFSTNIHDSQESRRRGRLSL